MSIKSVGISAMALFLTSSLSYAGTQNISTELQNFSVKTGATRLIYSAGTSGATLTVMNPQSYPMLVQSEVVGEDGKSKAPFIVTPPLFRLDGHQQSRIKVVATSNHDTDTKESLYWLCLTGIPPEPDSEWADAEFKNKNAGHTATLLTQLRIKTCLKLLIRPSSLKGTPDDFASSLTWKKNGKVLTVNNPTPFFINLKSVRLGTENIASLNYIPPMGTLQLDASPEARGPVHWRLITDYGGDSREFISDLN